MKSFGIVGLSLALVGVLGCPSGKTGSGTVDLGRSTVTVDRSANVLADGSDGVTITVTLVDSTGAPVPQELVQISVSGSGNSLSAAPVTDTTGATHATLTSTVAETKTITAAVSAGTLTQKPTVTFASAIGNASALAMKVQPTSAQSGAVIHPAVEVQVQDASGSVVTTSNATLTAALAGAGGGTLGGTTQVTAVNGIAVFTDLSVDKVGTGYTLSFTSPGLTTVVSQPFNISPGSSSQLVFLTSPSAVASGSAITPAVQVVVEDANGNVVVDPPVSVQLTLAPAGPTLSGTTTQSTANGIATFSDLSVDKAGTGYSLVAQASGYPSTSSAKFSVTPGQPSQLVFSVEPADAVSGAALAPAVKISVEDAAGNVVTSYTSPISVSLTSAGGAKLSGTLTQTAVNGVAAFTDLSVDKAGSYTLTANSGSLASAPSSAFKISAGAAAKLVYVQGPSDTTAEAAISPSVVLALQDANGNNVSSAATVTVALGNNPGGATLSGSLSQTTVNGTATFSNLVLDKTGVGYTLSASSNGVPSLTSTAFSVSAGSGSKLVFTQQATDTVSGQVISPAIQVTVQDSAGNVVTSSNALITLALANNPTGAFLTGSLSVYAVNGVATFDNVNLATAGTGYTLSASSPGIASVTGTAFNITPGPASQLVFTSQPPPNALNGATLSPVGVTVEDAAGNPVSAGSYTVSLALGNNPSGATLSGAAPVTTAAGVATFGSLSVNLTGDFYTLVATSSPALPSATSRSFAIMPAPITGTGIAHYLADKGQIDVVAGWQPSIWVPTDAGFQGFGGTTDADGGFSIPGVATVPYYLQMSQGEYLATNARSLDLGFYSGGRPGVQTAVPASGDAGTLLRLGLTNLQPWQQYDTLEIFSSNAGLWGQYIEQLDVDGGYPAVGATSINETIDYGSIGAGATPLVDATQGDQAFLWQLQQTLPPGQDAGIVYLTAAASLQTTTLSVAVNQTTPLSGAMTPLNQNQTVNLGWKMPAFEALSSSINPSATSVEHFFALDALPYAGHGFYASAPDLMTMAVASGLPNQSFPMQYGNPFTAWTLFGDDTYYAKVTYSVAGINGTTPVYGYIGLYDGAQTFPFSNLSPQLSPPLTPLINGQSAFSARIGVGLSPVLSWSPPSTGAPNLYDVQVVDLYADASGNLQNGFAGEVITTSTRVMLPPGLLLSGHHYVFRIEAQARGSSNPSTTPFEYDFPLSFADCLTAVVTP